MVIERQLAKMTDTDPGGENQCRANLLAPQDCWPTGGSIVYPLRSKYALWVGFQQPLWRPLANSYISIFGFGHPSKFQCRTVSIR